MATFLNNVSIGRWAGQPWTATLTGNVSRSGNTVTLSSLTCTTYAAKAWGSDSSPVFMIKNSGGGELTRHTGMTMSNGRGSFNFNNVSVSVGATATSYTFKFYCSDNGVNHNFTVTFPSGATAPGTPSCSTAVRSSSRIDVTYGISNLGNPSGSVSLYNGTTSNPTNQLQSQTYTGSWTYSDTNKTANTTYYYVAKASNSVSTTTSGVKSATTLPAGISSISSVTTDTTATFSVACASSGGALTTTLQRSTNNSTWTDVATNVQGQTISTTLTGLSANTSYTIYFRVRTSAGVSDTSSHSYKTKESHFFYGSVSGKTKRIKKLYGSVNGKTKEIKKLYASVNGKTKRIF